MEENNGRINEVKNPTMEELQKENTLIKQYLQNAAEKIDNLSKSWMIQRINWLFQIVDSKEFSTEFKVKAIDEIERYLYPKTQVNEENSKSE